MIGIAGTYKPHTAYALRVECVFNVEPGGTTVISCSGSQSGSHGPSGGHAKILRGQRRMTENYETAEWATESSVPE